MKIPVQTFISATALLCALTLSGCGSGENGDAENANQAHEAGASVSPGTITISSPNASPSPSGSVSPGSIHIIGSQKDRPTAAEGERTENHTEDFEDSDEDNPEQRQGSQDIDTEQDTTESTTNHNGRPASASGSGATRRQENSKTNGNSSGGGTKANSGKSGSAANNSKGGSGTSGGNASPASISSCTPGQVSISLTPGSAVAGSQQYTLSFTNTSNNACTLRGNPSIAHTDSSGNTTIGGWAQLDWSLMNPAGVTLQTGETTTAHIRRISAHSFGERCAVQSTQKLTVWLPGAGSGYAFDFDHDSCVNVQQLFVGQFGA